MGWSIACIAAYALLTGVASFIEVPIGRGLSAFQLNLLIRAGSLGAALGAVVVFRGGGLPATQSALIGLGLGVITGAGSIFYCFALQYMRVSLVVTFSNLYLVVTIVLGIAVLSEPVTLLKVTGLSATLVGVLVLSHAPARYGISHDPGTKVGTPPKRGIAVMAVYVAVVGVAAFLEKPALKGLDPAQLNTLMAIAMAGVAGTALGMSGAPLPETRKSLPAIGVGALIGIASVLYFLGLRGLPVSIAAAMSNAYIVVTVVLSGVVLREPLTPSKAGGIALTLAGASVLAFSAG